ncbi:MAG: hypothetical protein ACT4O2_15760 [Beijerinckiaceae bacterium]
MGFDGGKQVTGSQRHVGVDANGLPHMIHVATAKVTGRAGALEGFALSQRNLANVVNVLVDGPRRQTLTRRNGRGCQNRRDAKGSGIRGGWSREP